MDERIRQVRRGIGYLSSLARTHAEICLRKERTAMKALHRFAAVVVGLGHGGNVGPRERDLITNGSFEDGTYVSKYARRWF